MYKRYDVLTDIGAKLFESNSVDGVKNLLAFLDNNFETKKANKGSGYGVEHQRRLEKLNYEFENRLQVNDRSELGDDYTQLNTVPKNYTKGISAMASKTLSGSLESVGENKLFASVGSNNTFTKAYINKTQLSKLN
jgi:hypothetical protein